MAKFKNQFARVDTILGSAVANSATFAVDYPTGFAQGDFLAGKAGTAHYMIVNGNDRWTAAASKMSASFGASTVTVTNSTGATLPAGTKVSLYFDVVDGDFITHTFAIDLASITAADVITTYYPNIDGEIVHFAFEVDKAVTTAAKLATFNLEIGTTNLTGGTIALTSANATPKGAIVNAAAITGNNTVTKASQVSVEASAVTAFSEGTGTLIIVYRKSFGEIY